MTIWRMRIACRLPKATNTQSECVILTDLPLPAVVTRTRLSVALFVNVFFFVLNNSATYSREALPIHGCERHHISGNHKPQLKIIIGRFLKNLTATCSSSRLLLGSSLIMNTYVNYCSFSALECFHQRYPGLDLFFIASYFFFCFKSLVL